MPQPTDKIEIDFLGDDSVPHAECGHGGPSTFTIEVYGVPLTDRDFGGWCHRCAVRFAQEQVIRCVRCGLPIFPGDTVLRYRLSDVEEGEVQIGGVPFLRAAKAYVDVATVVDGGEYLLGCTRPDCAGDITAVDGYWDGKEFRENNPRD